ncbi:MerR family transcriptional regulator [Nocardiopsis terrae]
MSCPTGEVCRMSGVTSRTLRHYHHVGLLVPESTGPGGLRRYGRRELRRLQRILVMRELGLGPADIRRMWTPDADAFAHLGRVYAEEGPWREVYERVAPGLADYQREAMEVYAERSLRGAGT